MSDLEKTNVMLCRSFKLVDDSNPDVGEMKRDQESREPLNNGNSNSDDFRSLLNTNSRQNSELITDSLRMINCESTSQVQVSSQLNEIEVDLNSQIREAIDSTITKQILPTIQNCFGKFLGELEAIAPERI